MSDFIRPIFQSVTTYEATLTVAEVEAYSKNHAVSFDEVVETLGVLMSPSMPITALSVQRLYSVPMWRKLLGA